MSARRRGRFVLLVATAPAWACLHGRVASSGPPPLDDPPYGVLDCPGPLSIRPFQNDERFGNEWSVDAGLLAYNRKTPDGFENVFVASPDGSNERALTFHNPTVPGKHSCSPVWTPGGEYLFFSAEKAQHPGSSLQAFCGFGAYADLWAMTSDGRNAFKLTDTPNDEDHGVMIPRLSRDGRKLLWTERIAAPHVLTPARAFGSWVLAIADVAYADGGVSLGNVRRLQPGDEGFYEGADFTPDGGGVLFTSSLATNNAWASQIFVLDLATGALRQLTHADYNEHPRYTPDGTRIVWMSSTGAKLKGTDWWVMNADGTHKRRLTYFEDPDSPQSGGSAVYPGTACWDPTGRWFIGDVETSLLSQSYTSVRVTCGAGR
jgi:Tol biopolymer transport system component